MAKKTAAKKRTPKKKKTAVSTPTRRVTQSFTRRVTQPTRMMTSRLHDDVVAEIAPEHVLSLIHELEELTGKVNNAESEIVRTLELQTDLNDNLDKQITKMEELEAKTTELTEERDSLDSERNKLNVEVTGLDNQLSKLKKTLEAEKEAKQVLTAQSESLEEKHTADSDKNKELKQAERKLTVEIEKLIQTRKDLTS